MEQEPRKDKKSAEQVAELFFSLNELEKRTAWGIIQKFSVNSETKKRKNRYEEDFKLKAVEFWKKTNNYSETAREMSKEREVPVDEKNIRRWVGEYLSVEEFRPILKKQKLSTLKTRKYPEMEDKLTKWFAIKRKNKMPVSMKMFQEETKKIFKELGAEYKKTHVEELKKYEITDFKCSSGWFEKYRK